MYADDTAPYAIEVTKNRYIDAACERYYLAAINHKPSKDCNVKFLNPHLGKIKVQATKNIGNQEELFISYGKAYGFQHNHTTKKVRK